MAAGPGYDTIIKYKIEAVCQEPLHIGSAAGKPEEVLVHPVDGLPFVQASSIAGVFRDYLARSKGKTAAGELFEKGSRIRVSDGVFKQDGSGILMELRPRLSIDRKTGTNSASIVKGTERGSGHKFQMEYIGAGAKFRFFVYLYGTAHQQELEEIFAALNGGGLSFGGQKSNGCGYVKIEGLKRMVFDMRSAAGREKWKREDLEDSCREEDYEDITAFLPQAGVGQRAYDIVVSGHTEGELLIKAAFVPEEKQRPGEKEPDAVNMKNTRGEYIIPGSSLKGAIRSQMEKIAAYLGKEHIIPETFGKKLEGESNGVSGNITFFDTVVGEGMENDMAPLRYRIHIDKFTGGVMGGKGALFSEKNVSGKLSIRISIAEKNAPQKSCGLLLLALRDLAAGLMGIGSGYGIGKGILKVDTITILDKKEGGEAVIDCCGKSIRDESGLVGRLLAAVQE